MPHSGRHQQTARSFLTALARDVRANTLGIMAFALIPLAGMVGGGVDISRMYIVKTRLQHACDAGALAGRKAMGGGTWAFNNFAARTAAEQFFDANFDRNAYGVITRTAAETRTFTENAGKVTGTASAVLPMTLMKIFGRSNETLSVTCDAEMRLPNTDVMFVLDTTGSMADKAVNTDSDTKIQSLRTAVKCFYEIVARLDTDANCTTGTPSGGTGSQVQIRFGFVPYSVNVNVGRLLPTSYFPDSWNYQTRKARWITSTSTSYPNTVDTVGASGNTPTDWTDWTNISSNWGSCPSQPANRTNVSGTTVIDTPVVQAADGTRTWETRTYTRYSINYSTSWSWWTCYLRSQTQATGTYTTVVHTQRPVTTTTRTFDGWDYGSWPIDISGLKNGTSWNTSFTIPDIGSNGSSRTITWNGCIEERQTVSGTNFTPIPAGAKDLDIDSAPTSDTTTMWKPALGDIEYMRRDGSGNYTTNTVTVTPSNRGYADSNLNFSQPDKFCPTEARKLQTWASANDFDDYVDSLTPTGNTYHDIGLLWGARLLSPTGIFASENAYTPQGGEIERHLIFMTDGDTVTSTANYAAYGLPWYDRRNVSASDVGNSPGNTDMNDEINARFSALCTAIKNTNKVTLWVISFGSGSNSTTETRLSNCATSGRYFVARDSAALQSTFKSIADQISQLRLTR